MMDRIEVTRTMVGLVHMQVCVVLDASDEEILDVCNQQNPSGTRNGWMQVVREGEGRPVPCDNHPTERIHLLVRC